MNLLIVHEVNYLSKIIHEFQILPAILSMQGHTVTVVDYDDSWAKDRTTSRLVLRSVVHEDTHRAYADASVTVRRPGMISDANSFESFQGRSPLFWRSFGSSRRNLSMPFFSAECQRLASRFGQRRDDSTYPSFSALSTCYIDLYRTPFL